MFASFGQCWCRMGRVKGSHLYPSECPAPHFDVLETRTKPELTFLYHPTEPDAASSGNCNNEATENLEILAHMPSYTDFFRDFMLKNRPLLVRASAGILSDWFAWKEWRTHDSAGGSDDMADLAAVILPFEDTEVLEVAVCSEQHHPKREISVANLRKRWGLERGEAGPLPDGDGEGPLYLKDWHINQATPDSNVYTIPLIFQDDWLNEWYDTNNPSQDFRFCYAGPKGSWTPFHEDVYRSYSWSANVAGKKKWLLFPPSSSKCFRHPARDEYVYDLTDDEANKCFPEFGYGMSCGIEVLQHAGDVLFVPSGWRHQVWNVEDAISINHNWFNGCNVHYIWEFLQEELAKVEASLAEIKVMIGDQWSEECQKLLKMNAGMSYAEFFELLVFKGNRECDVLESKDTAPDTDRAGLARFNIGKIAAIVEACEKTAIAEASPLLKIASRLKSFSG